MVQVSSIEDVLNVLKLLSLQLVGSVNDKLGKVVHDDTVLIWLQVEVLVLHLSRHGQLLLSYDTQTVLEGRVSQSCGKHQPEVIEGSWLNKTKTDED